MKKVLLFGGSFSPPTLAHEAIIAECLVLPQFDEVWVLPSGDRLDKSIAINNDDRLHMLHLVHQQIFVADPRLKISDFELQLPRPTQTHQTVKELERTFPDVEFWFVFGRDSLQAMPSWPHGKTLHKSLRMVVFGDDTGEMPAGDNLLYLKLDGKFSDMSSSLVRQRLARGQSINKMVSGPVARYLGSPTSGFPS